MAPTPEDAKAGSVQDYIAGFPAATRDALEAVRASIRGAVPDATESISYGIAAFGVGNRVLMYLGGWATHVAIYPLPEGDPDLDAEMAPYRKGKGTLRFPLNGPMPTDLVARIATAHARRIHTIPAPVGAPPKRRRSPRVQVQTGGV